MLLSLCLRIFVFHFFRIELLLIRMKHDKNFLKRQLVVYAGGYSHCDLHVHYVRLQKMGEKDTFYD